MGDTIVNGTIHPKPSLSKTVEMQMCDKQGYELNECSCFKKKLDAFGDETCFFLSQDNEDSGFCLWYLGCEEYI